MGPRFYAAAETGGRTPALDGAALAALGPEALAPVAAQVRVLEPPVPCDRKDPFRPDAALLVDGLLVRVVRSRGALDLALGDALVAFSAGDRAVRRGWSGIDDYAREILGLRESTAGKMARLSAALASRPLLRDAVRRGEVTVRKAEVVLRVARGEGEGRWVERARAETVRALAAAVRAEVARAGVAAGGDAAERRDGPDGDEGPWCWVEAELTPDGRETFERALELAGRVLEPGAPRWRRLEAVCQEYLGAHPADLREEESAEAGRGAALGWLEAAMAALEAETARWRALDEQGPVHLVAAPSVADLDGSEAEVARRLDERLRALAAMREGWDALVGDLADLLTSMGLWRELGFASFSHYCAERLGMGASTVRQRAWLARRIRALPPIREAMERGRLSYEKARLVAGLFDVVSFPPTEAQVEAWIARAEETTCIALRREVEARDEGQMCAPGELRVRAPARVAALVDAAVRAAREAAGTWLARGEALERVAAHFLDTWKDMVPGRRSRAQRVRSRDGHRCRWPGCSRAGAHAHHVTPRGRGGADDEANLVALCAVHHLRGVHGGYLRVRGTASGALAFEVVEA